MFGGLRLEHDGSRGRPRAVPASGSCSPLLAIEANRVVATDRLTELHLGARRREGASVAPRLHLQPPSGARTRSRALRALVGARASVSRLPPRRSPGRTIDALRFEDLVERGIATRATSPCSREAIGLWADPLPEIAAEPVVVEAVGRWHGLLAAALEAAADLHLRAGDAARGDSSSHPTSHPSRCASGWPRSSALALYRTGRQADALRVIDRARSALADTAGLGLGSELKALERRMLEQSPTSTPEPSSLSSPLFGRDDELATLQRVAARLGERRGGVVTVMGPSGIGKTALVEELTGALERQGTSVAWARCPEGAAVPPFWPLAKVGLLDADAATASDPFAHAQRLAREAAQRTGSQVLVIDDLQWADTDTLRVLTHLAAELRNTSTFLITTSRPLAGDFGADLVACPAELSRQRVADVVLGELSEADIALWLGERAAFAAPIHTRTGGNPFFVREVIGLMGDGDLTRMDAVPPGVQAVVRRRVESAQPRRTAGAADRVRARIAVRDRCDRRGAQRAEPGGGARSGHRRRARRRVPSPEPRRSTFRFAHVIVGEALVAELNAEERAFRHAAVAKALSSQHPDDAHAAEIAFHAAAGASAATAALAVDASSRRRGSRLHMGRTPRRHATGRLLRR